MYLDTWFQQNSASMSTDNLHKLRQQKPKSEEKTSYANERLWSQIQKKKKKDISAKMGD